MAHHIRRRRGFEMTIRSLWAPSSLSCNSVVCSARATLPQDPPVGGAGHTIVPGEVRELGRRLASEAFYMTTTDEKKVSVVTSSLPGRKDKKG